MRNKEFISGEEISSIADALSEVTKRYTVSAEASTTSPLIQMVSPVARVTEANNLLGCRILQIVNSKIKQKYFDLLALEKRERIDFISSVINILSTSYDVKGFLLNTIFSVLKK